MCRPRQTISLPNSWNFLNAQHPLFIFLQLGVLTYLYPGNRPLHLSGGSATRCYLTFILSFVSARGIEAKLHLCDDLGPESSSTEIAPRLLAGLSHSGWSVCNKWQILLTMTEKAGGEQPKCSTIAKQVLRPDSALPGNPSGMHDQFGFGTEYSL